MFVNHLQMAASITFSAKRCRLKCFLKNVTTYLNINIREIDWFK